MRSRPSKVVLVMGIVALALAPVAGAETGGDGGESIPHGDDPCGELIIDNLPNIVVLLPAGIVYHPVAKRDLAYVLLQPPDGSGKEQAIWSWTNCMEA